MKKHLLNLTAAVVVLAMALAYYFGHDVIYRLMINASSLVQLSGK